jgi:NADH dehydrogenase [ubiquinone] 1 alpha subcomplex assembly factor 6
MATIPGYVKAVYRKTPIPERRSADTDRLSPVAALVRRHDRDRFQTALFAPAARREALFALYAFNYEIARVPQSVTQPMLGQIRLQWWRENIAAAFEGGSVRAHPVVEALTAAIRKFALARAHFDRLIDARESDLAEELRTNLAALEHYAEATSAELIYLALEALGVRDRAASEAGKHVGIAYGLAGLIRAIPYRSGSGVWFIPADVAARTGLARNDYDSPHGKPALRAAVADIAAVASRHLEGGRAHRTKIPRTALPALLPATIAQHALSRLKRAGYDPLDPALTRPDPLQSWRLAATALFNRF